jgi:hypothetical protein
MKKYFIYISAFFTSFFTLTSLVSAQAPLNQANGAINTLGSIVTNFTNTLGSALGTLAMAAGVIAFFYGIVQYIWGVREAKPEVIKTGNQFMIWGLVGLFVMFSVYGIIKFAQGTLFPGVTMNIIEIPEFNFKRSGSPSSGPVNQPSSSGPIGSSILCPDGTYAQRSSDCPSYTCPNGTVYYNPSDRNITCGSSATPSAGGGRGFVNPPAPTPTPSASNQTDYGCGVGKGFPDEFGSCPYQSPTPTPSASTQSEGNVGECIVNTACRTSNDYPGFYDSSCVCQVVVD